jgi:hypothetical protein
MRVACCLVLTVVPGLVACKPGAESHEALLRMQVAVQGVVLHAHLKAEEARVSERPGYAPGEWRLKDDEKRRELQKQLDEAKAEQAKTLRSAFPRASRPPPPACNSADPLCEPP